MKLFKIIQDKLGANRSFSIRLSFNIIAIVTILSLIVMTLVAVSSHRIVLHESRNAAQSLLRATIKEVEKELNVIQTATINTAWWAYANMQNDKILYHLTSAMVQNNEHIIGCAIAFDSTLHGHEHWFAPYSWTDIEGNLHSKQLGNEKYDYYQMEWFKEVKTTLKPHWSNPYYDEGGGGQLMVTYSYPIMDTAHKFLGVITADVSIEWLQKKMDGLKPYPNCSASLVNEDRHFVATTIANSAQTADSQMKADTEKTANMVHNIEEALKEGHDSMLDVELNGHRSFIVFGPLENQWVASISFDYRDIFSHASQLNLIITMISIVGLLLIFLFCYITILRITKPITALADAALQMATGDLNTPLPQIKSKDEMMRLRDAFAYMQKSLTDYIQELTSTTAANERMQSELNVARGIQMELLEKNFPTHLGSSNSEKLNHDIHAILNPAKQVGGDLYDYQIRDNNLYFAVGDVSGKGVPAALVMALTIASLRFVSNTGLSMAEKMERVNNTLSEKNERGMFVTLFIGCIDLTSGVCHYCNAGHNPIIVKPANGDAYYRKAVPNLAIGLYSDFTYQCEELQLNHGDKLLLYTDGVTEAERKDKSQFGEERLLQWANSSQAFLNGTSQEATNDLRAELTKFVDGNEPNDDVTIMVINI